MDYIDFFDIQNHIGLPTYTNYDDEEDFGFSFVKPKQKDIVKSEQQGDKEQPSSSGTNNNRIISIGKNPLATPNLMAAIQKDLGKPYVWGGHGHKRGADCIGFVNDVLDNLGYKIYASAKTYLNSMVDRFNDPRQAKPGDLLFWTFRADTDQRFRNGAYRPHGTPSHIAIVLDTQGSYVKIAESAGSSGSAIHWVKMFDGNDPAPGKIYANYSPSARKSKYEFLAFGRLNNDKIAAYKSKKA